MTAHQGHLVSIQHVHRAPEQLIKIFLHERFRHQQGGRSEVVDIPFSKQAATYMFEDFARMVDDPAIFEASVRASERTQAWLDAAWDSAVSNES